MLQIRVHDASAHYALQPVFQVLRSLFPVHVEHHRMRHIRQDFGGNTVQFCGFLHQRGRKKQIVSSADDLNGDVGAFNPEVLVPGLTQ